MSGEGGARKGTGGALLYTHDNGGETGEKSNVTSRPQKTAKPTVTAQQESAVIPHYLQVKRQQDEVNETGKRSQKTTETTQQETTQQNSKTWKQLKYRKKINTSKKTHTAKCQDQVIVFATRKHAHNSIMVNKNVLSRPNKHGQNDSKQQQQKKSNTILSETK